MFGRIHLQLFAEDAGAPAGGEPTVTTPPAPDTTPPAPEPGQQAKQTLAEFIQSRMAGPEPEPSPDATPEPEGPKPDPDAEPKETEPRIDVPDKFRNPDGSVNVDALVKSYTNMESMYSKQAPQLQKLDELQQTVVALQQQITQQAQADNNNAPEGEQLTPEEIQAQAEADLEKFWEEYNENPKQAIAKLVRDSLKSELEPLNQKVIPLIQEREQQARVDGWAAKVQEAKQTLPDFETMVPAMKEVIAEYGEVITSREDAVMVAYNLAKSKQAQATPSAKPATIDDLLNDPEAMSKLLQDPKVKNQVLSAHMQEIKNNPAPPVISTSGLSPSTQPVDLKDMKTAKEALKAKYAGFNLQ